MIDNLWSYSYPLYIKIQLFYLPTDNVIFILFIFPQNGYYREIIIFVYYYFLSVLIYCLNSLYPCPIQIGCLSISSKIKGREELECSLNPISMAFICFEFSEETIMLEYFELLWIYWWQKLYLSILSWMVTLLYPIFLLHLKHLSCLSLVILCDSYVLLTNFWLYLQFQFVVLPFVSLILITINFSPGC